MLWEDRTIHGNALGRTQPNSPTPAGTELARASVFVSMSPLRLMSADDKACRRRMAELGMGNGHASHHVPTPDAMAAAEAGVGKFFHSGARKGLVETVAERQLSSVQLAMIPMIG